MTTIAPKAPGSTFNERTGMWTISTLEMHWSCPVHDVDVNRDWDCQECGNPAPEILCWDCMIGEDLVSFDENGWATLTISRRRLFAGEQPGQWVLR